MTSERGVMVLDHAGPTRQLQHFIIAQHKPATLCIDNVARACALAIQAVNHFHFFAAEPATDNRASAGLQSWLENDPLVGRGHALYDGFAQAPGAGDSNPI